jgi:hypothetical protein
MSSFGCFAGSIAVKVEIWYFYDDVKFGYRNIMFPNRAQRREGELLWQKEKAQDILAQAVIWQV